MQLVKEYVVRREDIEAPKKKKSIQEELSEFWDKLTEDEQKARLKDEEERLEKEKAEEKLAAEDEEYEFNQMTEEERIQYVLDKTQ